MIKAMPDAMLFEEGIITVKIDINVFFLLILYQFVAISNFKNLMA